jgi:hypothetical protein
MMTVYFLSAVLVTTLILNTAAVAYAVKNNHEAVGVLSTLMAFGNVTLIVVIANILYQLDFDKAVK